MKAKAQLPIFLVFLALLASTYTVRSQFSLDVTVQVDEDSYLKRELVEVTGNVTYEGILVQNGLVGIQVQSPLRTIAIRTLPLNNKQSLPYTIEITSLLSVNEDGDYRSSTERGKYLWFNMTVKNKGFSTQTVWMSISVLDSRLIPLEMDMAGVEIPPNSTAKIMPRMFIPNWATVGAGYIYGDAFTSFPTNGGRPLCPEKVAYFNIIESSYYNMTYNASLPSPPTQNGTFQTSFRLPPDMTPGIYQVIASAWSPSAGGYTGWGLDSFQAVFAPAPPWPSFVVKPPGAGPNYTITFDASSSSSENYNDTIISYFWDFGDGKNKTGRIVTYSYTSVGNYIVILNVTDSEGFWNVTAREVPISIVYDIAILDVECLDRVYDSWDVYVDVTIQNKGTYLETFDVTLRANGSLVEAKLGVQAGPYETKVLTFSWDTTGLTLLANYNLEVQASAVPGEINLEDNSMDYGPVLVTLIGDIAFNRKIDLFDAVALLRIYGLDDGDPQWEVMADLVRDGKINLFDAVVLLIRYGTSY